MLDTSQDTQPLSLPTGITPEFLQQLKETGAPIVLTINGTAEAVVQDPTSYEMLLELVERLDTIGAIHDGLASIDRGEGRPAEEVFEEIRKRHNLPHKA
jgi:PHD/YefM family antitoxin component YafN of YafNO toxin-antitoxin module